MTILLVVFALFVGLVFGIAVGVGLGKKALQLQMHMLTELVRYVQHVASHAHDGRVPPSVIADGIEKIIEHARGART